MHQTITCKLKSSENDFPRQFYLQNCDFAIFCPNMTGKSIQFAAKSSPYVQAKEFNDFQFYYFPFKPKKKNTQIKIYICFLNHFSKLFNSCWQAISCIYEDLIF